MSRKPVASLPAPRRAYRLAFGICIIAAVISGVLWSGAMERWMGPPSSAVGRLWVVRSPDTGEVREIRPHTPVGKILEAMLRILGVSVIVVPLSILIWELAQVRLAHDYRRACRYCGAAHHDGDACYCTRCGGSLAAATEDNAFGAGV